MQFHKSGEMGGLTRPRGFTIDDGHGRKYAYIIRLRKIAVMLGDRFLDPGKKEIKMAISSILNSRVKW